MSECTVKYSSSHSNPKCIKVAVINTHTHRHTHTHDHTHTRTRTYAHTHSHTLWMSKLIYYFNLAMAFTHTYMVIWLPFEINAYQKYSVRNVFTGKFSMVAGSFNECLLLVNYSL